MKIEVIDKINEWLPGDHRIWWVIFSSLVIVIIIGIILRSLHYSFYSLVDEIVDHPVMKVVLAVGGLYAFIAIFTGKPSIQDWFKEKTSKEVITDSLNKESPKPESVMKKKENVKKKKQ